jgi:hypothetical protein
MQLSTSQLKNSLFHFLHRYHVLIFVLVVVGGLSVATFLINQAINTPTDTSTQSSNETFDKDTIQKVEKLRKPNEEPAPLELPAGRINPFI